MRNGVRSATLAFHLDAAACCCYEGERHQQRMQCEPAQRTPYVERHGEARQGEEDEAEPELHAEFCAKAMDGRDGRKRNGRRFVTVGASLLSTVALCGTGIQEQVPACLKKWKSENRRQNT